MAPGLLPATDFRRPIAPVARSFATPDGTSEPANQP